MMFICVHVCILQEMMWGNQVRTCQNIFNHLENGPLRETGFQTFEVSERFPRGFSHKWKMIHIKIKTVKLKKVNS